MQSSNDVRGPFEQLAQGVRRDFYVSKDGSYDEKQRAALVADLKDWRTNHPGPGGKPQTWQEIANRIGIAPSVLGEVLAAKYAGDTDRQLRLVDQFLALEAERRGRLNSREFVNINVAKLMRGTVATGIKNNSCPVVIGPPGCGKTLFARALVASLEGSIFVRVIETKGTAYGILELLFEQLPRRTREETSGATTRRQRLNGVLAYLHSHRGTIIVVDEAQKLHRSGLEMLRDLHDLSDQDGRLNIPIVFFADEKFYRHLLGSRGGKRSVIAPQLSRRLYPIFDVERDGVTDDAGRVFSVEDLVRVLKNDRLKLVTPEGVRWLTMLANVQGYGSLGFAVAIAGMAWNLSTPRPVTAEDLQKALKLALGPPTAEVVDVLAGGELLAKTA